MAGATVLPLLAASAPAGFTWSLDQMTYGWAQRDVQSTGATATAYGHAGAPAEGGRRTGAGR